MLVENLSVSTQGLSVPSVELKSAPAQDKALFDRIFVSQSSSGGGLHAPETSMVSPPSFSSLMMEGVKSLGKTHSQKVDALQSGINELSSGKSVSVGTMFKLQVSLMDLSIQQQITSKVSDKTSEGVKTLFRNQ